MTRITLSGQRSMTTAQLHQQPRKIPPRINRSAEALDRIDQIIGRKASVRRIWSDVYCWTHQSLKYGVEPLPVGTQPQDFPPMQSRQKVCKVAVADGQVGRDNRCDLVEVDIIEREERSGDSTDH